ncbi:unnamed protein product [Mytilus edulis]|uniref:Uncharacterized protein n=1 Tax=Mytilus edulis TaxID=6550 RepID=A0A8S3UWC8_MYTED|nr:unnamed protein product [Mytilus edulis]
MELLQIERREMKDLMESLEKKFESEKTVFMEKTNQLVIKLNEERATQALTIEREKVARKKCGRLEEEIKHLQMSKRVTETIEQHEKNPKSNVQDSETSKVITDTSSSVQIPEQNKQPNSSGPSPQRLPCYDGKTEWKPYYMQFIHFSNRYKWDSKQRLDRLIECLRDKALKFYSTRPLSVQNDFVLLSEKMNQRLEIKTYPIPLEGNYFCSTGAGKDNSITARYADRVAIKVGKTETRWRVIVADITDPVILGLDVLQHIKAVINLVDLTITVDGEKLAAAVLNAKNDKIKICRVNYDIEDLKYKRQFLVNLELSICLESSGPCMITVPVLENAILPKSVCEWENNFIDPEFSFDKYIKDSFGLSNGAVLSDYQRKKLGDVLGITEFLMDKKCLMSDLPYTGTGWNNGCNPMTTSLPSLPGNTACYITDNCNTVQCCTSVDKIGQSYEAEVSIDLCLFKLNVRIEKLELNKDLLNLQWGTPVEMWLFGLVRVALTLYDLETEGNIMIDMTMSVCLDADVSVPCYHSVQIFKGHKLPKSACEWKRDFPVPDPPNGTYSNFTVINNFLQVRLHITKVYPKPNCSLVLAGRFIPDKAVNYSHNGHFYTVAGPVRFVGNETNKCLIYRNASKTGYSSYGTTPDYHNMTTTPDIVLPVLVVLIVVISVVLVVVVCCFIYKTGCQCRRKKDINREQPEMRNDIRLLQR